mmetsp:Transcript_19154/g.39882  ORF Transcript_19154/g.39882 Transcript_19154/m.39882 type:complete len:164 (-) Transcript_19154:204-695(-)
MSGIDLRPASAHLEPGCYKIDRDFVLNDRREVRKGGLTDSSSAPTFNFNSRPVSFSPSSGAPEDAEREASPDRAWLRSAPAWSMPRGMSQASARQRRLLEGLPAPGSYEAPSRFDSISRSRQEAFDRLVRRTRPCQWEQEFGTIFRSMHASASQTRHMKAATP